MCSYQQINNSYGCANSHTLNYLLKGELGFQGFVLSDWQAQHSGASSILAGLDMSMPGDVSFDSATSYQGANLTVAVLNGTIPEWRIDDMATRIIAAYYLVGRDRNAVPVNFNSWSRDTFGYRHAYAEEGYELINQHVDVRAEHRNNIRDSAAKSTILLKNEGVLPLNGREKNTAVFGQDADTNPYGPNGCNDHGCNNGTLAMGWGSGTSDFPYLVTPLTAIQNEVLATSGNVVQSVTDNWAYTQIARVASQASVSIVFINADSGEGYISVDGNEGDRNNLTAWENGETLIQNVTAVCNNTIVVVHSVGPILLTEFYDNPNVTAIVWASLPGEQSGNSLADVLYGRVNPGGKLPFTLGARREDYGTDVLYQPNNGELAPQDEFVEGVFIDYRYFDKNDITPIYEFGFGLSYTTFSYSNLQVQTHQAAAYTPTTGTTSPAPVLGSFENDTSLYQFPPDIVPVAAYIYPYLNGTDLATASNDTNYGRPSEEWLPPNSADGSAQPRIAAGGAPGGNPQLYDILFTVTATITNTGAIQGDEVVQLYLSRGGPNDPVRELRGFDRLTIAPGGTATFSADLTRRDVSNWDPVSQNWVITSYPKTVFVGASSRNLQLSAALDLSAVGGGEGAPPPASVSGYTAAPVMSGQPWGGGQGGGHGGYGPPK
jgi:beta-glucosidase